MLGRKGDIAVVQVWIRAQHAFTMCYIDRSNVVLRVYGRTIATSFHRAVKKTAPKEYEPFSIQQGKQNK